MAVAVQRQGGTALGPGGTEIRYCAVGVTGRVWGWLELMWEHMVTHACAVVVTTNR